MFNFFQRPIGERPTLPNLDESLYPLSLQQQTFAHPNALLLSLLKEKTRDNHSHAQPCPQEIEFSKHLQEDDIYQHWINFTVFGRYIQRSFSAFYRQTEDIFNADMPELLRHELMRHTQRLPLGQVLFCGSNIPGLVRREKLILTTLSPYAAIRDTYRKSTKPASLSTAVQKPSTHTHLIINQISITSKDVKAFAIKHNKRTSERYRHEVMILDFDTLRLTQEKEIILDDNLALSKHSDLTETNPKDNDVTSVAPLLLRYYELR